MAKKRSPLCVTSARFADEFHVDAKALQVGLADLKRVRSIIPSEFVTVRSGSGRMMLSVETKGDAGAHVEMLADGPEREFDFVLPVNLEQLHNIAKECPGRLSIRMKDIDDSSSPALSISHQEVGAQGASIDSEFKMWAYPEKGARAANIRTAEAVLIVKASCLIEALAYAKPIKNKDAGRYTSDLVLMVDDAASKTIRVAVTDGRQLLHRTHVQGEYEQPFSTIVIPRKIVECLGKDEAVHIRREGEVTYLVTESMIFSFGQKASAMPVDEVIPKNCTTAFLTDRLPLEQLCMAIQAAWHDDTDPAIRFDVSEVAVVASIAKYDGLAPKVLGGEWVGEGNYILKAKQLHAMLKRLPKLASRVVVTKGERPESPATISAEGHPQVKYLLMPCQDEAAKVSVEVPAEGV